MSKGICATVAFVLLFYVSAAAAEFALTSSTGGVLKEVNDTAYLECAVSERWQTCLWSRDSDGEQFVWADSDIARKRCL